MVRLQKRYKNAQSDIYTRLLTIIFHFLFESRDSCLTPFLYLSKEEILFRLFIFSIFTSVIDHLSFLFYEYKQTYDI